MARWNVGMVGWRRLHCPDRLFSDLYFDPWFGFAGPSPDGESVWTLRWDNVLEQGELQEWSTADLSLLNTVIVAIEDDNTARNELLAVGPGYLYYSELGGDDIYRLYRASLTTGSIDLLLTQGAFGLDGLMYNSVDDRLYFVDGDGNLVRCEVDGTGVTTLVAATVGTIIGPPVWTSSYVWAMRFDGSTSGTGELVRVRISDGDVTVFTVTGGGDYGSALQSTGSVVGVYEAGIDLPTYPDVDNWYFQYAEVGTEIVINNRVIVEMVEENPGHGNFIPSTFDEGGCPHFVFSGRGPGGGSFVSSPYSGKQTASGASWFISDYGTYGALWRFA